MSDCPYLRWECFKESMLQKHQVFLKTEKLLDNHIVNQKEMRLRLLSTELALTNIHYLNPSRTFPVAQLIFRKYSGVFRCFSTLKKRNCHVTNTRTVNGRDREVSRARLYSCCCIAKQMAEHLKSPHNVSFNGTVHYRVTLCWLFPLINGWNQEVLSCF